MSSGCGRTLQRSRLVEYLARRAASSRRPAPGGRMSRRAFPVSGNIEPLTFPLPPRGPAPPRGDGLAEGHGPTHPKALYFRAGRILFGSSNDSRDQLGAILIDGGRITREQLDEVNAKVGPGNPLAKVLSESGFVSQRELNEAARHKVERILSDVLVVGLGHLRVRGRRAAKGSRRPQALDRAPAARRGAAHLEPRVRAAPRRARARSSSPCPKATAVLSEIRADVVATPREAGRPAHAQGRDRR